MALTPPRTGSYSRPPRCSTSSSSHFNSYLCRWYFTCLSKGDPKRPKVVGLAGGAHSFTRTSAHVSGVLRQRGANVPRRSVLKAADERVLDYAPLSPTKTVTTSTIEIPVSCYQLIGVSDQAEKDEVVKSVMQLKRVEVEEGYSFDATMSRQNLLMDVRDKLLFEPEYAGNVREKIPPKSSLRIPWAWLPGALCLLQEVGQEKLVIEIGRAALPHPEAKPYTHDLLLSMALAECAIAKIGFEKNKVSHGFEALARAECILRSKSSLAKMALLSEIEESLEELAPACTLELLGLPHSPENAERRQGAISALCELLRQGLDVDTSCRVQDWPCFLTQAFSKLMAAEIVDLLPWNDLATIRKNRKSLESQNQRVVIDFSCFYMVLIAHVALGFSSKQTELINKAEAICECLMASEGVDLKFEEAFCLFLLGQGNEAQAIEKLQQLELSSNPGARSLLQGKEIKDVSVGKPSLETWLKDAVLAPFPDTRDCPASLVNFFQREKRTPIFNKSKVALQTNHSIAPSRPASNIALRKMDGESLSSINSSQHVRSAVKQLAPDLQSSLILGNNGSVSNDSEQSTQLNRNLGLHHDRGWESRLANWDVVGKIIFVAIAVLGGIGFINFKLLGMRKMTIASKLASSRTNNDTSSLTWERNPSVCQNLGPAYIGRSKIAHGMKKILEMVNIEARNSSKPRRLESPGLGTVGPSAMATVTRKQMPVEEAEALVKQWQAIKAEALGPTHQLSTLREVLDESMLDQWQALADAAKARSCYWRFVLLQLSVLQADILSDKFGIEIAEIEALLEEAAELVDETQQKYPNYYSTYKVRYVLKRQDDGSWRFCQGVIQTPS